MNPPASTPEPYFIVYIDEAGDPGLTKVRPRDPSGASEWLLIGAVVVRSKAEPHVVDWVRSIRFDIKDTQGPDLHFRTLSDHRKERVCDLVSALPLRGFVVASHKPNMRGWRNLAAEAVSIGSKGWFYNWCIRLLLERVTAACYDASVAECSEPRPIKLIFSQRGGVKYNWLKVYLQVLINQSRDKTTVLRKREIRHEVLNTSFLEVLPSRQSAGCQLADVVTSAFYTAVDARGPRWNTGPAKELKSKMAKEAGFHMDFGVALHPTPARRAGALLTSEQKQIFEFYDYDFR